jgi:hypothetical protein
MKPVTFSPILDISTFKVPKNFLIISEQLKEGEKGWTTIRMK